MTAISPEPSTRADSPPVRRQGARATLGSFLGGTMEFYDFGLYATASALIFPTVFFAGVPQGVAVALSYVILAAGYVARPIGGIVIGHFGDRIGRKRMLILTMVVMGGASVLIGLIPGSAAIGSAAPILLVALRIVQGLAIGGEWAGATLMAMEHSRRDRRGFAGSVVGTGGPTGSVLATLVVALVATLPPAQLLSWGWRIPFLCSAVIVVVALIVRAGVGESPEFVEKVAGAHRVERVPLVAVLQEHWRSVVLVALGVLSFAFVQSLTATVGLTRAVGNGVPQSTALWMVTLSNALTIVTVLLFGLLATRIGRRRGLLVGYAVLGVMVWAAFACWSQPSPGIILLGFLIIQPLCVASVLSPMVAYAAEMFPASTRFTGNSVAYQGAVAIASGFAPLVAGGLIGAAGGGTVLLAVFVTLLAAVGFVAALASRGIYGRLNPT